MSKETFLKELDFLLQDISDEDREDALAYYEEYFDAAGPQNEAKVLMELQTPERVAALIKAGLRSGFEESIEYSETTMGDSRYNKQNEVIIPEIIEDNTTKENTKSYTRFKGNQERNGLLLIGIILVFIFGLPIFGTGFGFLIAIVAILFAFGVTIGAFGFSCVVISIAVAIQSVWKLLWYPAASIVGFGISILFMALGILFFKSAKWPFKAVPELFRAGVGLIRTIFDKLVGERR